LLSPWYTPLFKDNILTYLSFPAKVEEKNIQINSLISTLSGFTFMVFSSFSLFDKGAKNIKRSL